MEVKRGNTAAEYLVPFWEAIELGRNGDTTRGKAFAIWEGIFSLVFGLSAKDILTSKEVPHIWILMPLGLYAIAKLGTSYLATEWNQET
jgi:hypothetical protein